MAVVEMASYEIGWWAWWRMWPHHDCFQTAHDQNIPYMAGGGWWAVKKKILMSDEKFLSRHPLGNSSIAQQITLDTLSAHINKTSFSDKLRTWKNALGCAVWAYYGCCRSLKRANRSREQLILNLIYIRFDVNFVMSTDWEPASVKVRANQIIPTDVTKNV